MGLAMSSILLYFFPIQNLISPTRTTGKMIVGKPGFIGNSCEIVNFELISCDFFERGTITDLNFAFAGVKDCGGGIIGCFNRIGTYFSLREKHDVTVCGTRTQGLGGI